MYCKVVSILTSWLLSVKIIRINYVTNMHKRHKTVVCAFINVPLLFRCCEGFSCYGDLAVVANTLYFGCI